MRGDGAARWPQEWAAHQAFPRSIYCWLTGAKGGAPRQLSSGEAGDPGEFGPRSDELGRET